MTEMTVVPLRTVRDSGRWGKGSTEEVDGGVMGRSDLPDLLYPLPLYSENRVYQPDSLNLGLV